METTLTHPPHDRRAFVRAAAAGAAALAVPGARAQNDFPKGPVKIIVGLPPGGAADVSVRAMAPVLEKRLGKPVVVENRPGGNFQISVQAMMTAPADGQTLLYMYNGYSSVHAVQKLFDIDKQMVPVTQVGTTPIVLLVKGDSPYKTMADLVAHLRANPDKVPYGMLGVGGVEHLKLLQIDRAAGVRGLAVPYKGGPDMLKALLGGEIAYSLNAGIFAKQFAPSGQVRVLAVLEPTRWADFPNVPTLPELGINVPALTYWGGYAVKAGTPPQIVQRLHAEIVEASKDQNFIDKLVASGGLVETSRSPEDFRKFIAAEVSWMTEVAKGLNVN